MGDFCCVVLFVCVWLCWCSWCCRCCFLSLIIYSLGYLLPLSILDGRFNRRRWSSLSNEPCDNCVSFQVFVITLTTNTCCILQPKTKRERDRDRKTDGQTDRQTENAFVCSRVNAYVRVCLYVCPFVSVCERRGVGGRGLNVYSRVQMVEQTHVTLFRYSSSEQINQQVLEEAVMPAAARYYWYPGAMGTLHTLAVSQFGHRVVGSLSRYLGNWGQPGSHSLTF